MLTKAYTDGYKAGMMRAAIICGTLAETTYDDADGFMAATGCEASILAARKKPPKDRYSVA